MKPNEIKSIVKDVVSDLNSQIFGAHLMNKFPLKMTSPIFNSDQYKILKQVGSPAMTDGKNVYFSADVMSDLINQKYYEFINVCGGVRDKDELWRAATINKKMEHNITRNDTRRAVKVILLHEYTHAFNEHCKLKISTQNKSQAFQTKLNIACEIQANDGILGEHYALDYIQQPKGVTNKRLFPETIGYHTLKSIMEHLPDNNDPRMQQAAGSANKTSEARGKLMKSTGEYEKQEQAMQAEKAKSNSKGSKAGQQGEQGQGQGQQGQQPNEGNDGNPQTPGVSVDHEHNKQFDDIMERDANEAIEEEIKEIGMSEVRSLMLASLSDKLKYDPESKSVIYDNVKKRVNKSTYARPSKRIGMYGNQQYQVIRKGNKVERVKIPQQSNHLTVLAVDCSGSMYENQSNVASITDNLLAQVKQVAKEKGLEVNYDNLQGMFHESSTSDMTPITSDEWKQRMHRYCACGGNDFGNVLRRIDNDINVEEYEDITIINISDGLDAIEINGRNISKQMTQAIEDGKVKWIDAIINTNYLNEAENCARHDDVDIRRQVILKITK